MNNFVRTGWGIECFLCKTEFGYKSWMLLPSGLSDEEVSAKIEEAEQRLKLTDYVVYPTEITVTYKSGAKRCPECGEGVVGFIGRCEICGYNPPRK